MAEHWKSTPRYWCKHCACYVRDTKLEKQNHEATGRHQGALKRSLREIHRGHEREVRDKERAQQEIARLNGITGSSSNGGSSSTFRMPTPSAPSAPTEASLKKQREQLAELGVAMPSEFRPEMAMAGEWTVTNTRVIEQEPVGEEDSTESKATGIRKREVTEDEKEEEEAVQRLFKKPKKWGIDSKVLEHGDDDKDLDALLNGSLLPVDGDVASKAEAEEDGAKTENSENAVKAEPDDVVGGIAGESEAQELKPDVTVKTEETGPGIAPIVFKKRRPKGGMRQK